MFALRTKKKNYCVDCLVLADRVSLIHLQVVLIDRVPVCCFQVFKKFLLKSLLKESILGFKGEFLVLSPGVTFYNTLSALHFTFTVSLAGLGKAQGQ